IFERIWADLAPFDPDGVLRHEWANSRGCIARFERGSIEVRVIDAQECPAADLAICKLVVGLIARLAGGAGGAGGVGGKRIDQTKLRALSVEQLVPIFLACVRGGDEAVISDAAYLDALGVSSRPRLARQVWSDLAENLGAQVMTPELHVILDQG